MDSKKLLKEITEEVLDTKGKDLKVLDLRRLVNYTDYFILVTGTSDRHVQAIADKVNLRLKKKNRLLPITLEGYSTGQWILLDYGDAVLHIFQPEQREYYDLDHFWGDAPVVKLKGSKKAPSRKVVGKKS